MILSACRKLDILDSTEVTKIIHGDGTDSCLGMKASLEEWLKVIEESDENDSLQEPPAKKAKLESEELTLD